MLNSFNWLGGCIDLVGWGWVVCVVEKNRSRLMRDPDFFRITSPPSDNR